jgi:hypothetical protein
MPFFLLQADTQGTSLEPDPPAGSVKAMVVRADDDESARAVADANCGSEGPHVWTDPTQATCHALESEGEAYPVLRAFNA